MSTPPPVWFVTGASAGLGRALVSEIARRGDMAIAAARNTDDVGDLVDLAPERVLPVRCDVTDEAEIAHAVRDAEERFGRIDVLVNNAGYGLLSTLEEAGSDQIERQFAVNLFGPIRLMRAILPGMRRRGRGTIVNISSSAGSRGIPGSGYYCASKAALEALGEALAGETENLGIRSMLVTPGPLRTDFMGRSIDQPSQRMAAYEPIAEQRRAHLATDKMQAGDTARAAALIIETVLSPDPPMRLPLGSMACASISNAYRTKLADIARSESVAPKADFAGRKEDAE
ncbi:SDR family NAD(P)-dependent oxidoreductase [Croceicoccus sp. YJ47]|uniref:SDR family NAD(P)-dependent oxidoreductase n=1 Tax=Croceicoccus sp. YJ47 TaxID=2798724 RepID=UPI001924BAC9|nr:SDR family NAD(P)-dependent oxidoreductase [Croceicoccus sp. YJ47]QQN75271.1 SDR family NAD(P)-dependent oxidoreductase [Croceicoccus sp. YJ47]